MIAIGALIAAVALSPAQAASKPKQSGQLDSIEIEGESRVQIRRDKPADIPAPDLRIPLQEYLADNSVLTSPADRLLARLPILLPPRTASDLVLSPWRTHLWSPPVLYLVIKDAPTASIKRWKLTITNDKGVIFRTLGNGGRMPDHIEWDGLSDKGEPLQVGHPYSCALSLLDRSGVPAYLTSKTVRLDSYVDQQSKRVGVYLVTSKLFAPGPVLTDIGAARLAEARDLLRAHFKSIRIDVYDEDVDLAQRQADVMRKNLEEGLHRADGAIAAKGRPLDPSRYSRTEIVAK